MTRKITYAGVLSEGFAIGLRNVFPLLLTYLLWVVTIWIPYINVGTTIAISTIPVELGRGRVINPLFIFNAKYRQFMGEYFILLGLMGIAFVASSILFLVPTIVIAISWSLAIYLLLDKGLTPLQAIMVSNKATNGYKWLMLGVSLSVAVVALVVLAILSMLPLPVCVTLLLAVAAVVCLAAVNSGCSAVIYRDLTADTRNPSEPVEVSQEIIGLMPTPIERVEEDPFEAFLKK